MFLYCTLFGYEPGPSGFEPPQFPGIPPSPRLALLKEHVRRRFTLDWSITRYETPFFSHARLIDGLLVGIGLRCIIWLELPSQIRGTSYRIGALHSNILFQPVAFACDPAQDLVLIVELYVFYVTPGLLTF